MRTDPCMARPSTLLLLRGTVVDGSGATGRARRCRHARRPDPRRRRSVAGRRGRRRARPGPGRAGRDARLHRPARPLGRIAVPGRRPGQPPPPGLHDPAVGQLRRHARADHRRRPRARRPVAPAERARRRAGRRSGSTSIGSRSSRSGRTSRSSSATARSAARCSVPTPARRPPDELAAMVGEVEAAMDAGAIGSVDGSDLCAGDARADRRGRGARGRDGAARRHVRDPHAQRVRRPVRLARRVDRAVRAAGPGARLQVSHLKCGSRSVWGRAGDAVARLEAARAEGLDVGADQYPYTAAATTLATILPPALQALGCRRLRVRARRSARPRSRPVGDRARDLGLGERGLGSRLGRPAHRVRGKPARLGRPVARRARRRAPRRSARARLRCARRRPARRLGRHRMHDEPTSRRSWPSRGSRSAPMPRAGARATRSSMPAGRTRARTGARRASSGPTSASAGRCPLETAVAKLTSVPAARLGLRDRGVVREGAAGRPRRPRSGDRRRRGDVRRAGPLPASASSTSSSTGDRRSSTAARPASGPDGCCGERDRHPTGDVAPGGPAGVTETAAVAMLAGGPLAYTLRRSPRSRGLRVVIHPDRGVVVTVPARGRRGWADPERHVDVVPRRARAVAASPPRATGPRPGGARGPRRAAGRGGRSGSGATSIGSGW